MSEEGKVLCVFFVCMSSGLTITGVADSCSPKEQSPPAPVSSRAPCPTTADNAKLREAHAMCDQRAKEWERRARE